MAFIVVGAWACWCSRSRSGRARAATSATLKPGAPELREDARYNRDAVAIVERFGIGLDVLTIVNEVPEEGCYDFARMTYIDRMAWHMANQPGVTSVSLAARAGEAGRQRASTKAT